MPDSAPSPSPESPAAADCLVALVQLLEAIKQFVTEKEAEAELYGDPEVSHATGRLWPPSLQLRPCWWADRRPRWEHSQPLQLQPMARRRPKQLLSPEDLALLEWLRPIPWEIQREELERLLELPAPPR